jgi:hypothetical protein
MRLDRVRLAAHAHDPNAFSCLRRNLRGFPGPLAKSSLNKLHEAGDFPSFRRLKAFASVVTSTHWIVGQILSFEERYYKML